MNLWVQTQIFLKVLHTHLCSGGKMRILYCIKSVGGGDMKVNANNTPLGN